MSTGLRAFIAVALLAGFYVLALGSVAALCAGGIALVVEFGGFATVKIAIAFIAVAGAIVVGLFKALKRPKFEPYGVRLNESEQPHLWGVVRDLANRVGTKPPDEIWLVPEVNAAVAEDTRVLGLVGGRRYMLVGLPLLLALTTDQLRAVLGHELGHYSHSHTRLGAINYRGRMTIIATMAQLRRTNPVRWLFAGYARIYFLVESAVSRRQELEADQAAGAIAGRRAAQTALHEVEVLAAAWGFYLNNYVGQGLDHDLAPRQVFPGFSKFLSGRQQELSELRKQELPGESSRWDSHPATPERIAKLASAPEHGVYNDNRPSWQVLVDIQGLVAFLERESLDFGDRQALDWPEYTMRSVLASEQELADAMFRALSRITGRTPESFETVLSAGENGQLGRLWDDLNRANAPEGGFAAIVTVAAIRSGVVRVEHRWDGPASLLTRDGAEFDPSQILQPLTDGTPAGAAKVRGILRDHGIDLRQATPQQLRQDGRRADAVAAMANLKVNGNDMDLILTDQGLVLVPAPKRSSDQGEQRLANLLQQRTPAELASTPGSLWIPFEEIVSAEVRKEVPVQAVLNVHGGHTFELKETWSGEQIGKSRDTLLEVLAKFTDRG
ncbi:M48 family metallopeptidase [Flindersiella endophytica]